MRKTNTWTNDVVTAPQRWSGEQGLLEGHWWDRKGVCWAHRPLELAPKLGQKGSWNFGWNKGSGSREARRALWQRRELEWGYSSTERTLCFGRSQKSPPLLDYKVLGGMTRYEARGRDRLWMILEALVRRLNFRNWMTLEELRRVMMWSDVIFRPVLWKVGVRSWRLEARRTC